MKGREKRRLTGRREEERFLHVIKGAILEHQDHDCLDPRRLAQNGKRRREHQQDKEEERQGAHDGEKERRREKKEDDGEGGEGWD